MRMAGRARPRGLRCAALLAIAGLACGGVRAEHPLLAEDPGTQGKGRSELELGFAAIDGDPSFGGRGKDAAVQLSYGLVDTVDLIIRASWQSQSPVDGPKVSDIGDTMLDLKWRLGSALGTEWAVRAGLDLPTGNDSKGLGAGKVGMHAIGVAGWQWDAVSVYANAAYAYTRQPGVRQNLGAFSLAVLGPEGAPLRTFLEATTYSNTDPGQHQWPAIARTGLLYTVQPGVVVDIGYQARLNASAPRQFVLAGLTLRW
jgi:Putative MetA-pathway of phenol degradation